MPMADTTPNPVTTIRGVNADLSCCPLPVVFGPSAWYRRTNRERLERDPCAKRCPEKGHSRARATCSDEKGSELGRGRGPRRRRGQGGRNDRAFVRRQPRISEGEVGQSARRIDVLDEPGAGDDQADNVIKIGIVIDAVAPRRIRRARTGENGEPGGQREEETREPSKPRPEPRHSAFDTPELRESQIRQSWEGVARDAVALALRGWLLGRPASESGKLRQGDGSHLEGDRRRSVLM